MNFTTEAKQKTNCIIVGVLLLVMGIILCDRRRKSKKRKRASARVHKRMTEKVDPPAENSQASVPPTDARLPESIWPRMAENNQTVHDYWHNDASRQQQQQQQGWHPGAGQSQDHGQYRYQ